MKKLILMMLLFAACRPKSHDGLYYKHIVGQYAIDDDTIEIHDNIIIEHVGFQKVRNGKLLPKEYKIKELFELHPRFDGEILFIKSDKYYKIN